MAGRPQRDGQPRHPRLLQVRGLPARHCGRRHALARLVGPGARDEGVPAARHLVLHVRGHQLRGRRLSRQDAADPQPARLRALHPVLPAPGRRADRPGERLPAAGRPAQAVRLAALPGRSAPLPHRPVQEDRDRRPAWRWPSTRSSPTRAGSRLRRCGSPCSATRSRSTATSPATPTWPSAWPTRSASSCPTTSTRPYLAASPADFWRRWHISLSRWLRDYLYIPLGGNRRPRPDDGQPVRHDAAGRTVARGELDVRRLGGLPRVTFGHSAPDPGLVGPPGPAAARDAGHVRGRLRRLGVFPAQSLADAATILRRLVVPTSGYGLAGDGGLLVLACLASRSSARRSGKSTGRAG